MPVNPVRQLHDTPARGDNKSAILRAAQPGGPFAIDGNLTILCGEIWLLHWTTAARNGYTRVVDKRTGHVRPMTKFERHAPGSWWGKSGIKRWRRPNGEHPLTYDEAVAFAVKHHVVIIGELKSRLFAQQKWANKVVAIAKKHDHPAWFKGLFNMKFPGGKAKAIRAAGGQFALIFGKFVKGRKARLAAGRRTTKKWVKQPTRIW